MADVSRRRFLRQCSARTLGAWAGMRAASAMGAPNPRPDGPARPNILFAIADDWSWPHAPAYGASGLDLPAFQRVAAEGCLFAQVFAAAPQCAPNRAALLTGRHIGQLEEAGTHASIFPSTWPVFPDLLESAGYHVGYTGKGWGPGDWARGGFQRNPAGPVYNDAKLSDVPFEGVSANDYAGNFDLFLDKRPPDAPFFFWYGASEPHRGYEAGSGLRAGKSLDDAPLPPFLPDDPVVRGDILDYLLEVEWFDRHLGRMLARLEALGELDNTLVIVTSDNGMPFPGAKANLHEYGIHMPMAIRWPARAPAGHTVDALIGFVDLAPTFLEAAGVAVPASMSGRSFLDTLRPGARPDRAQALAGRERHTHARYDNLGYPARAIRTADYLYIRNFKPDLWPAGDPEGYHDVDGSPTKSFMLDNRERYPDLFAHSFGKRPEEELFDVRHDPGCLRNLAGEPAHAAELARLRDTLMRLLEEQGDPRALGTGDIFDSYPRVSPMRPELGGFAERGAYNPKYRPQ